MKLLHHGVSWHDHRRWYVRGGLVVWWLGQALFGACIVAAVAVLYLLGFNGASIDAALACLLAGLAVLLAARWMLAWVARRRRRHNVRIQ